jgi:hypothetical protein
MLRGSGVSYGSLDGRLEALIARDGQGLGERQQRHPVTISGSEQFRITRETSIGPL